jgi:enamine deaminase RidA (YjgF/YER057c/UK114 family)
MLSATLAPMSVIADKLHELGITLPAPGSGAGNYLPSRRSGNLLFLAGAISVQADGVLITGKAGVDKTLEDAYAAAKVCAINQLGVIAAALGSLDAVSQIVTVNGYVNAAPDFIDVPQVINGASDLLVAIFGDAGRHARAAIGVASLPKGALVEVQMTVEIKRADG